MKSFWKAFFLLTSLLYSNQIFSQISINGIIVEKETNLSIPGAGIISRHTKQAILSQPDGTFTLKNLPLNDTLLVKCIGFETLQYVIRKNENHAVLFLKQKDVPLQTIEILPGQNPAHRIITCVINNKDKYNTEKLSAYSYESYNKMRLFPENPLTISLKADSLFKESDLLLWESITKREFGGNEKYKETVLASRISGANDLALPLAPSDLQSLTFYSNFVTILGNDILSPLCSDAIKKYRFYLADTLIDKQDTIFTIQFFPAPNIKSGFEGQMSINTKHCAIVSIDAKVILPSDNLFFEKARIIQYHECINDSLWFPKKLDTEVTLTLNSGKNGLGPLRLSATSFLSNINLSPIFSKGTFDNISVDVALDAAQKDTTFWNKHRKIPLTKRDKRTYSFIDSLGSKNKILGLLKNINKLMMGVIPIGPIDLHFLRLYEYNPIEKHRFGFGISTNEKLTKYGTIGGWFGYGLGDKKWKYGINAQITPFRDRNLALQYNYEHNLICPGTTDYLGRLAFRPPFLQPPEYFSIRKFYMKQLEYVDKHTISFLFASIRNVTHAIRLRYENIQPQYVYTYTFNEKDYSNSFTFYEGQFYIRFAPGEKYMRTGLDLIRMGAKYPVIEFQMVAGSLASEKVNVYEKISLSIAQAVKIKGTGIFRYQISGGKMWGFLPYTKLMIFPANGLPSFFGEPFTFNTLPQNQLMVATEYAMAFLHFRLNNPGFPSLKYSPELNLAMNSAWGNLNFNHSMHSLYLISPNKVFLEAGISISNLLPKEVVKYVASLSLLSVGVYYRMGAYADPKIERNFVFKVELNASLW